MSAPFGGPHAGRPLHGSDNLKSRLDWRGERTKPDDEGHLVEFCWSEFFIYNFGFNAQSLAQDRPLKKINWGMTALSAAMWIPWLAKDAKIYQKNGLDVEIVLLRGSGQSSQALLGGSLFAAPVALPQVMLADLQRRRSGQRRAYYRVGEQQVNG